MMWRGVCLALSSAALTPALSADVPPANCSTSFPVLYLTLASNSSRAVRLQQNLEEYGWTGAAWTKDLEAERTWLNPSTIPNISQHSFYEMPQNELSILFGHRSMWEHMVEKKMEAAVFLEDDAHFRQSKTEVLCPEVLQQRVAAVDADWDVLVLHKPALSMLKGLEGAGVGTVSGKMGIYRTYLATAIHEKLVKPPKGVPYPWNENTADPLIQKAGVFLEMVGYMVSSKGAEKLNKLFQVVYSSLDDQFNMGSPLLPDSFKDPATGEQVQVPVKDLRVYMLNPGVFTQYDGSTAWSTIKSQFGSHNAQVLAPKNSFGWRPKPCWLADGYNCTKGGSPKESEL